MRITDKQRDKIIRLYVEEKWHVEDIAFHMGMHRATIYRMLNRESIPRRDDRSNAQRKELATECGRGHEFTDENTYWSNGSRTCKRCHQTTQILREFMSSES